LFFVFVYIYLHVDWKNTNLAVLFSLLQLTFFCYRVLQKRFCNQWSTKLITQQANFIWKLFWNCWTRRLGDF